MGQHIMIAGTTIQARPRPHFVYSRPRYDSFSHSRPLYASNLPSHWHINHLKESTEDPRMPWPVYASNRGQIISKVTELSPLLWGRPSRASDTRIPQKFLNTFSREIDSPQPSIAEHEYHGYLDLTTAFSSVGRQLFDLRRIAPKRLITNQLLCATEALSVAAPALSLYFILEILRVVRHKIQCDLMPWFGERKSKH